MKKKVLKGLKRDTIDKFYTSKKTARLCYKYIKKYLKIARNDLIIEPSAGNGVFIPYIKTLSDNYKFYDIRPDNEEIIKCNFLKYKHHNVSDNSKIHIIGNPPFGRKSSMAIKFIKKSCEFCDTVSFILPKSFKKSSLIRSVPSKFHLKFQIDLPKDSFLIYNVSYDVPCVFQIWVKKSYDRKVVSREVSKYFLFCKKSNNPDAAIVRVGINAGKVYTENVKEKNENTHYFIKILKNKAHIIGNKYNSFNNTVGARSISRQELINFYNICGKKNKK